MNGRETRTLVIRADADSTMGTGHLMRSLALAQAWQANGGRSVIVTRCESLALRQRLVDEGCQVVQVTASYPNAADWGRLRDALLAHKPEWVVLDGYHFDSDYHRLVRHNGQRLLVVDDMAHLNSYDCDIILNQNIHAEQLEYLCQSGTRLLLGTRYAILRREFWRWRGHRRKVRREARNLLVTMGGSDPDNLTGKVIEALEHLDVPGLEVRVVVGGCNSHVAALQSQIADCNKSVEIVYDSTDMSTLMDWADLAVSAAGSTCWELAFMGLPSLIVTVAENQVLAARALSGSGVCVSLGQAASLTADLIASNVNALLSYPGARAIMSQRGPRMVDGLGAVRVAERLAGIPT